jgi:undecaprenyl-diphosphatase
MAVSQTELQWLDWLNSHHVPGTLPLLQFLSAYTTWINVFIVFILLFTAWKKGSRSMWHHFFSTALVMILTALLIWLLKTLFDRDRPFSTYPFIEKLSLGGGSSFPSGHTMETFAIAFAITRIFRIREIGIILFLWASLVGYTRMALGVHFPSDVAGGAILGMLMGFLIPLLYYKVVGRFAGRIVPDR